jgi:juvenile hormone diol kinase
MRTYFKRIDFDGDGEITQKDFQGMADRFIKVGGLQDAEANQLRGNIDQLWETYRSQAGNTANIAQSAFIAAMERVAHDHVKTVTEAPFKIFFQIVDTNHDNNIEVKEFGDFFRIMGVDEALASQAFKAIDTNNDGLLSLEEFVAAGVDFFTSQNESPNQFFFGPLVD